MDTRKLFQVGNKVKITGITDEFYRCYNGCEAVITSTDNDRIMVESTFEKPNCFIGAVEIFEENLRLVR